MTGGGLGLDMLLSCSSCAGSGLGLDMSLSCSSCASSGNSIGWSHGMDGIRILGAGSADGDGWLMTMVGGRIGDSGRFEKGSENWDGL